MGDVEMTDRGMTGDLDLLGTSIDGRAAAVDPRARTDAIEDGNALRFTAGSYS